MDTLLTGVVIATLIIFMAVAVFVSYCLGALTVAILDRRWRTQELKKEKLDGDTRTQS